ncbi:hypothetical protein FJU10_17040 [Enterococcus sp. OL5]|nr:hypothetical protein FJU10_17040 [Enterococcus sp. OL5]
MSTSIHKKFRNFNDFREKRVKNNPKLFRITMKEGLYSDSYLINQSKMIVYVLDRKFTDILFNENSLNSSILLT